MRRLARPVRIGNRGLLGMALLLGGWGLARGEEPAVGMAVGSEVVLAGPDVRLRAVSGDRDVSPGRGTRLKVERIEGGWVLVALPDGRHRGWIGADRLIPRDRAMEHFDRAIARDPKGADAFRMRGRLREGRGEDERALADYDRAIRLAPDRAGAYLDRGALLLARMRRIDDAIDDFDRAIRLDPRDAEALAARAEARATRRDYPEAIDDYDAAIALDPGNASWFASRGRLWARRGDHDRAIADYDEAIRLDPRSSDHYLLRAAEWDKDMQPDRAVADYQAAIAVDPRATAAYVGRGRIWRMRRDFGRLLANYEELVRSAPDDPVGHREVAWLLATCDVDGFRDGRRALHEATAACELTKWADPACLEAIAAACAEVGDFEAAVRWQTRAIQIFNGGLDKIDRKLAVNKGRDARMSNGLYRYKRHLPQRERPDRTSRVTELPGRSG